jgi:hypothetical protein
VTRAHDAALAGRLASGALAGIVWWDKPVPDVDSAGKRITKYLRVRSNTGLITAGRLTGPLGPRTKTYYLTGVGTSPGQAAWVLEEATGLLLNHILDVPGWSCRRLELASSQSVDMDPDVDNRFFGVDSWDVFSEPVPTS